MEINIKGIGIKDAVETLENLALIGMNESTGDLPVETLESLFEVMAALASAVRKETEVVA